MLKRIGFIGLGNMGSSMARNLIRSDSLMKQYEHVMVFDLNPANLRKSEEDGGIAAKSIAELAANCDYIITMLPATAHVTSVLTDKSGVFSNAKKGSLIIDSSTIDPIASKHLTTLAVQQHGHRMLDAPVSGGVTGAAAGTLTFMVGGEKALVHEATDIFLAMGKNVVHCGEAGAGGATKLCNNLALAIQMIGTSEAMALGVKFGLDPVRLAGVMNTSTARCWSSDSYNPVPGVMEGVPSSRGYTGGFGSALMSKDLGLVLDAAKQVGAELPLGEQAAALYRALSSEGGPGGGYAGKDFSVVYEHLMRKK